jgi:CBS-domain-containing membrane protein
MLCSEIMKKKVVSIEEHDTVMSAARLMRDFNVGFLPVCDATGKVIGAITDRDIATRVDALDRQASACEVGDIMTRDVVSCRATDDMASAEVLMAENGKSRLMVTDERGFLEGVFSLSDIAQFESPLRTAATIRKVTSREARF